MRVIAFYSLKGGVGKTAAAFNIAYLASLSGLRTVLWDLDPQGASTWYLGGAQPVRARKLAPLMKGKTPIGKHLCASQYARLDFIPAHTSFRKFDVRLDERTSDQPSFKDWLSALSEETSLVILDCPPSMSNLAEEVMRVSDAVFVPVIPTWLSLNSWNQLASFAKDKKLKPKRLHPFYSMVDRRKNLHRKLVIERKTYLENGLNALIPNNSLVERMGDSGKPVEVMAPGSAAADAYRRLWKEIQKQL